MSGLTNETLEELGTHLATLIGFASTHDDDPGTTGANETTGGGYARQAVSFNVDADGDLTLTASEDFNGPASDPVHSIGLWTAVSGGTFRGSAVAVGAAAYNTSGEYRVTGVTILGTSS